MKKLLMIVALIANFNAFAGIIDIDVSASSVAAGDSITVNILASDFEPIDTFDFRLNFDSSIFEYDTASLISDLSLLNPFGFLEINAFDGYIAFSFLDFDPIVTPDFTLASFSLNALSAGNSDFSFNNVAFYQDGFTPVNVDSSSNVSVNITEVPEPATWLLIPFTLLFLGRRALSMR